MLYFASASSFTNTSSEPFSAPLSVSGLFSKLEEKYPEITDTILKSCALTINLEYIDLEDDLLEIIIKAGDEVALIPPVSSG